MTDWNDMSEADRDAANEFAWARAADRLRQTIAAHPHLDAAEARRFASAAIDADIAEEQRVLGRSRRARATKMDIRCATNCAARIQSYALEQGFISDVDV